jgi:hypothetical protein
MRYIVVAFIIFILSLLLLSKFNKKYFIFGFALLSIFLRFTIAKILPFESTQIYVSFLRGGSVFFVVLLLVIYAKEMTGSKFFMILILGVSYFTILGVYRQTTLAYLSLYTSLTVSNFFISILFVLHKKINFSTASVVRFCVVIGLLQCMFGIIQYIAPQFLLNYLTVKPYTIDSAGNTEVAYVDMQVGSIVQGTLIRFNVFGNFMAFVFLLQIGYNLLYLKKNTFKNYLIALIFGFCLLLSGNRASLISVLAGAFCLVYYFRPKVFYASIFTLGLLFIFYGAFIKSYVSSSAEFTEANPFQRIISAFSMMNVGNSFEENGSTLALSYSLIPDFINNFIWGAGEYFKHGYLIVGETSLFKLYDAALIGF